MTQENNTPVVRQMTGVVVSNAMDKTIVVKIERQVAHPKYGKLMRKTSKIHAHDEENKCQVGDVVTVAESRPYSKTKTWKLLSINASN